MPQRSSSWSGKKPQYNFEGTPQQQNNNFILNSNIERIQTEQELKPVSRKYHERDQQNRSRSRFNSIQQETQQQQSPLLACERLNSQRQLKIGSNSNIRFRKYSKDNFESREVEKKHQKERQDKGWDQYCQLLKRTIKKQGGGEREEQISHLISTPLVQHKNYFEKCKEVERNLNGKDAMLFKNYYSHLDKKSRFESSLQYSFPLIAQVPQTNKLSSAPPLINLANTYSIQKHLRQTNLFPTSFPTII